MKIYVILIGIIAVLLVFIANLKTDLNALKAQNLSILSANTELNGTLRKVIKRNELEKKLLVEKFNASLQVERKKRQNLDYVKQSPENNITLLFNDTIERLLR